MSSSEDATSKCFSGVLRRLLCTGSLPTYPSDQIPESDPTNFNFPEKDSITVAKAQVQAQATPGIVARLMGLDSLPAIPKQRSLESILRSRSVNYTGHMPEFDPTQAALHRRVRTSVSFRETPTFINQQSPDFFVLCFEKALCKANEKRVKEKNLDKGIQETKLKKAERSRNRDNTREKALSMKERNADRNNKNKKVCKEIMDEKKRVSGETSSEVSNVLPHKKDGCRKPASTLKPKSPANPIKPDEALIESSFTKKKKNQNVAQKVKPQCCNSLNSSPIPGLMNLNSRANSSSTITNCVYPSPKICHALNTDEDQELRVSSHQDDKAVKSEETECYTEMLVQICRLAEENMEDSNWVSQGVFNFEDFEEICIGFEHQIFELLLNQVADELVGIHKLKNLTL
ncbi:uncharacterized protein LOC132313308 [Cornus florida]|uniref:uncharacterized protein LOC132313308 n=1 Tax=Cornus florida TaxID=4283 RepID=UPI0028990466|nr:uncharacterized protein LOC132313308 [Cornus florida]